MENEIKKDVWDVRVLEEVTLRVDFFEELTEEQAMNAMLNKEFHAALLDDAYYESILDERDPEIIEFMDAE